MNMAYKTCVIMNELCKYTDSDFANVTIQMMNELSSSIVFTRQSLERMLVDHNSYLYEIR